eukprot:jgi/Mesvir1/17222/Mv07636-RA.1
MGVLLGRFLRRLLPVRLRALLGWKSTEARAKLVLPGINFGEGPRFHNGHVYFSDMHLAKVVVFDVVNGTLKKEISFPCGSVSGLGWLPDGRMLVVAMKEKKLLVHDEATGQTSEYVDVGHVSAFACNDMVVDTLGRAYVGNFGFDLSRGVLHMRRTTLVMVDTDRSVRVASKNIFFPNGAVLTPDGKTLIVAETLAACLTAFDVAPDGSLSHRRVWAWLGVPPDGICLDAEGCVWVAVPQIGMYTFLPGGAVRVREGGAITHILGFGGNGITQGCVACMLTVDKSGAPLLCLLQARQYNEQRVKRLGAENARLVTVPVAVGPARHSSVPWYNAGYC